MSARHRVPSARAAKRAVDTLAALGTDALAHIADAILERLDARTPDPECEPDDHDGCGAEDVPIRNDMGIGEEDDAEPDRDDEPSLGWPIDPAARVLHGLDDGREHDPADDKQADGEPVTGPANCGGILRAERDGLVRVRRVVDVVRIAKTGRRRRQRVWWERRV